MIKGKLPIINLVLIVVLGAGGLWGYTSLKKSPTSDEAKIVKDANLTKVDESPKQEVAARVVLKYKKDVEVPCSWYGKQFHGRETASGTKFNMYAMTVAHKKLPLGTIVRLTNPENGISVMAKVTDRGPYVGNRKFDLSYACAKKLGCIGQGEFNLKVNVLEIKIA